MLMKRCCASSCSSIGVMSEIKTVPRIESFKRALSFVENPLPVINMAIQKYGDTYYTRIIGGRKIVMTIEPHLAKHILQKRNKNYVKSELQTESLGKYVGLGLLTANGDYWLRQRRLIQPGFHKAKLASLIEIMHREIVKFYDDLEERVKINPEVDINAAMMELTLRVVSKSLFSTGISEDKIVDLGNSINALQQHIVREVRLPLMNWWRRLNGAEKRAKKLAQETRGLLQVIIDERRNSDIQHDDLLDMLLQSRYEDNGQPMSNQQVLDEAIILFVAGYETTANTLAWCFHSLRENIEVQERVTQEAKGSKEFSMGQLMQPDYLGQVLDETMRKYPAAWILDRVALEDDSVDGVEIRKGDLVGLYVYGTHRNPQFWPEPDKFDPDRFLPELKKSYASYSFFPFGGGPRMCIGYHFAYMEMKIAVTEFMNRFVLPPPTNKEPEYLPLITLKPKENIRMNLILRDS